MSFPIVSVVIPTYNRASSIRAAVESALRQTVREIEVLVVDDGSTDNTASIASQVDDPRVKVILRERNGGAAAARNTGIVRACGDYVAFLDSDDVWLETKLARQIAVLGNAPLNTVVCCTGAEIHLLDHGGIMRHQYLESSVDWKARLVMGCDLSPGTTQMSRRDIFAKVGLLDESLRRFEDWDWLLRYAQMGGAIATVREPLARVYNRRGRLGQVTEEAATILLGKRRCVLAELSDRERRQAIADLWLVVVGTYAFEGHFGAAIPSLFKAMRQRPIATTGRLVTGSLSVARGRLARLFRL